jgi:transcription elongation GreA/GreB family factor
MTRPGEEQRPTYLTEVGRRHLEDRLGEYVAQRARMTAQSTDPTDVQDSVDQSDRLEAADELARLDDQIAYVQDTLRRALPLPAGAADGVIRLGSTVRVRDDDRVESSFTLLDAAELEGIEEAAAIDSPLGRALIGHQQGDKVVVQTPERSRRLWVLAVHPYRPASM